MDKIYYDHFNTSFVVDSIHDFNAESKQYTEITKDQHYKLLL